MTMKPTAIDYSKKEESYMPKLDVASGELVSASKTVGRDDPNTPQPVPATVEYAYQYDDIGNRRLSGELGTNRIYTANNLNQYTSISNFASTASFAAETFHPQFDDDGNQTLIQTPTGIWQVQYNGENSPWMPSYWLLDLDWSFESP